MNGVICRMFSSHLVLWAFPLSVWSPWKLMNEIRTEQKQDQTPWSHFGNSRQRETKDCAHTERSGTTKKKLRINKRISIEEAMLETKSHSEAAFNCCPLWSGDGWNFGREIEDQGLFEIEAKRCSLGWNAPTNNLQFYLTLSKCRLAANSRHSLKGISSSRQQYGSIWEIEPRGAEPDSYCHAKQWP